MLSCLLVSWRVSPPHRSPTRISRLWRYSTRTCSVRAQGLPSRISRTADCKVLLSQTFVETVCVPPGRGKVQLFLKKRHRQPQTWYKSETMPLAWRGQDWSSSITIHTPQDGPNEPFPSQAQEYPKNIRLEMPRPLGSGDRHTMTGAASRSSITDADRDEDLPCPQCLNN